MSRYQHDCSGCIALGQWGKHDLYYCPDEPTVIARFGTHGEYYSGLDFIDTVPALWAAHMRATALGLFDEHPCRHCGKAMHPWYRSQGEPGMKFRCDCGTSLLVLTDWEWYHGDQEEPEPAGNDLETPVQVTTKENA